MHLFGYPLADEELDLLNSRIFENGTMTLYHLLEKRVCKNPLTLESAYDVIKKKSQSIELSSDERICSTVKTRELAGRLEIKERTARHLFAELEHFRLLTREGCRGGWYVTTANLRLFGKIPKSLLKEAH